MGVPAYRIFWVPAVFVVLIVLIYLEEGVMHLPGLSIIPVLTGLAFIFVGIYTLYLLIKDLLEKRKAISAG